VAYPARCPRCTREVRTSDLAPIPAAWVPADEDAATLRPRGCADAPTGVKTCTDCREELRGLHEDQCRWDREARLC